MTKMATKSYLHSSTKSWHRNCSKTSTSLMYSTIATPYWIFETTTTPDILSPMSETFKIIIMVTAILAMVGLIVLYAAAYRMCCSGNQPYHDSCLKGTIHVILTLITYVFYLFDTLSDVFLCLHYISIGQISKFVLIVAFTFAPVLFLAFLFFAKQHNKFDCGYHNLSWKQQLCFQMFGLTLVLVFSPFAALMPTFTYAQVLARGKSDNKFDLFVYYISYLALVEATLESAPQLTIHIYLLIVDTHMDTINTQILRYLSIAASSLRLAWSLNAFKHQYRKTKQNEEDSYLIKFVHWVSRFAEIVPRIILIALLATEYDMIAVYFIVYRLLFGAVYGAGERWCDDKEFRFLEEPDLLLGKIGNIFCFSVSDVYKCHKQDQCGGKCFGWYYFIYYAENAVLLFLWYSDDQALLELKIGRSCSNHAWYAPYIFVVVILGFIFQPLLLFFYYRLRRKQRQSKAVDTADDTESQTGSLDYTSSISSDSCSNDIHNNQGLTRHQHILQESSRRQPLRHTYEMNDIYHTHMDQHFDNNGFEDERLTPDYNHDLLDDNYGFQDRRSNFPNLQGHGGCEKTYQRDDRYRGEREHIIESHQLVENHRSKNNSYFDERPHVRSIPAHDINQMEHLSNRYSHSGMFQNQQTHLGWPVNVNNQQTHFASRYHNQFFVGNGCLANSSFQSSMQSMTQSTNINIGQYGSYNNTMFSGY